MKIGDKASISRVITMNDILKFSKIAGDENPLHDNPEFAQNTKFGGPIAQGMLIGSLISGVLGTKLPGPGCLYLEQNLKFISPVKPNDTIKAIVEVENIFPKSDNSIITLHTWCTNQNDNVVIDGRATMMI